MSKAEFNTLKDQVKSSLDSGGITLEELGELGSWCVGQALGGAILKGLESMGGNSSTD